ncbi:MAG: hypothetical protein Q8O31_06760 [Rhodocyclaceae bacterium]|nr:hypothetical protein [Rhodocyclaceae bacterium]
MRKALQSENTRLISLPLQKAPCEKKQAMRFFVWDEPRVIGCAENYPNHIALRRACLDATFRSLFYSRF